MKKSPSIVIASDSFKGSATTYEVARFIENGIRRVVPECHIETIPVADGGEGTVSVLVNGTQGVFKEIIVTGPDGNKIICQYGIINGNSAVVEVAETSGLTLIDKDKLDPLYATSYGLGELIKHIITDEKIKHIYIGLGGSATNDGGVGMAQALGAKFTDDNGDEVGVGANCLGKIKNINIDSLKEILKGVRLEVLSDVTNPLTGIDGATYIFGKQKGIKEKHFQQVDMWMQNYQRVILEKFQIDLSTIEGGGAAGGLGATLVGLCGADIKPGINRILEILNFEEILQNIDLVITGEGRMDEQSLKGKTPVGIANIAKKYDKPVIAIVGSYSDNLSSIYQSPFDLVLDIINEPMDLDRAIINVKKLLENAGETAIRSYLLGMNEGNKVKTQERGGHFDIRKRKVEL